MQSGPFHILGVTSRAGPQQAEPQSAHVLTSTSNTIFLSHAYRLVFILDVSPSMVCACVCICTWGVRILPITLRAACPGSRRGGRAVCYAGRNDGHPLVAAGECGPALCCAGIRRHRLPTGHPRVCSCSDSSALAGVFVRLWGLFSPRSYYVNSMFYRRTTRRKCLCRTLLSRLRLCQL